MLLMFAYGMNTNIDQMAQRCPESKNLGPARLNGFRFRFAGHADIVQCNDSYVDGVLWEITHECLKRLDSLEGFPYYYDRKEVFVNNKVGAHTALTYFMVPGIPDGEPSDSYRDMVLEGYKCNHIPINQVLRALSDVRYLSLMSRSFQ